jgi:hypothetical protein
MRRPPALVILILVVGALSACGGDGSGWVVEAAPPRAGSTTISRGLGESATLHGPDGLELLVSVDFTSRPPVPISLSPENATFLEVHLSVTNTGSAPFSGVLSDAADLAVVPAGTLAPVRTESVPSEIALSGGADFGEPVTIAPGAPPLQGKVVFQIDPDDVASSFSLTIVGSRETAEWAL